MTITGKEMNHGEKSPQVYVKPEGITSIVSLISTYRDAPETIKAGSGSSEVDPRYHQPLRKTRDSVDLLGE